MFIISLIALIHINSLTKDVSSFSAFMSDDQDETSNQHDPVDNEDMPHGTRTPPTPPSRSPPPTSPLSSRVHAVAHLRPVCLETLDLPVLPDDRSQFDVHGTLEDDKIKQLEYI